MSRGGNLSREHTRIRNDILRAFGTRSDMRVWTANVLNVRIGDRQLNAGIPGQADITGILPDGRRLEIEVKSGKAVQSDEQLAYERIIERFGGVYVLARSVEDVWMRLEPLGVKR